MPRDLPEVAVFASGRYATAWSADGQPIDWTVWTDADLQRMAENDAHLRSTGQPAPYVKPGHDADPVPGFVGPLRFAAGKLYAAIEKCADWLADQIAAGVRPWRSAEILRQADAANFQGVTGPIFKGIALLNTHPRVKTLDSAVYAETNFSEPGALPGSLYVTTFQESCAMQITAEQTLAALKALGGDQKLLEKVLAAISGESSGGEAPPAKPEAPAAGKEPEPSQMSDAAARRIATLEADQALLKTQLAETKAQRVADIALTRTQNVLAFADSVSYTHGKAIADRAKVSAEVRLKLLPATENFADGKDLVADVFTEIRGLIGPGSRPANPLAAQQQGGIVTGLEDFSEERVKAEIFAELHPLERAHMQSAAGAELLKATIAKRKAEHEKARAV